MERKEEPSFSEVENEPTPYGLDPKSSSVRPPKTRTRTFATIGIAVLVFLAIMGFLIFSFLRHPVASLPQSPSSTPVVAAIATTTPIGSPQGSSTITTSIEQTTKGQQLVLRWGQLPDGTKKIDIYYSPTKDGIYKLIGSIPVLSLIDGSGSWNIPSGDQGGYYYGVPVGNGTTPSPTSSDPSSGNPTSGSGSQPGDATSSPTSTGDTGNNGGGDSGGGSGNGTSTPSTQNFLVQHVDEKIQISWQALPANTFQVVVSRAASTDSSWTPILSETNITSDGPYSIEVVDNTLGDPYYYKMDTYDQSSTIIASYGPILLEPL